MSKRTTTQSSPPSLEQFHGERAEAKFTEHAKLVRDLRAANARAEAATAQVQGIQQRLGLYEALDRIEQVAPPTWLVPKKTEEHHAIPSMLLTDIHWDEVIDPAQVDGYNCYNRTIAYARVERAFKRAVHISRTYFSGVTYDGFQLFLGGDLLSGIIHEELTETNQGTLCEAILTVIDPLQAGIDLLAREYGRVNVTCVVGNHGRRTKKPRSKMRAQDSFDWLVYQLIAKAFAKRTDISMQVSPAADAPVRLYNTRYLLTHGDQFRGGSGISAALAPLLLGVHRKGQRQNALRAPYDVMVMGHWHQTIWLPSKGLIVGGSVIGYNEHDYVSNHSPEPPQCSLWLTTPEHGITMTAPVFVQDRVVEGW